MSVLERVRPGLARQLGQILGWRTREHVVVFESDDWGSMRMPSNRAREILLNGGAIPRNSASHFHYYDSLERTSDLSSLFETLASFKGRDGETPCFTALCLVANPDYESIERNDFGQYFYEPLTETVKRLPGHGDLVTLWKEGAAQNLFLPEFHGREHLNVAAWMRALREGRPKTRLAFDCRVSGINPVVLGESRVEYQAAFDMEDPQELRDLEGVIADGTALFRACLGREARFFVPTNGPFNLGLLRALGRAGVRFIVLDKLQREPLGHGTSRFRLNWLGRRREAGLVVMSRNASFEPAAQGRDWVDTCLAQVQQAFSWRKPAVISTHRVNYMGLLDEANRTKGLASLRLLLKRMISRWPDIRFFSSVELGEAICRESSTSSAGSRGVDEVP